MAEYANDIDQYLPILFPSKIPQNTLADIISAQGLRQLHIAETEKYAHVTFSLMVVLKSQKPEKNVY